MPTTADIVLKVGDTNPPVEGTLKDGNNKAVPLAAGDAVVFRMGPVKGELADAIVAPAEVVDGPAGRVRYEWQAGDTAEAGLFEADFHVTFAVGGSEGSFPNGRSLLVQIIEAP